MSFQIKAEIKGNQKFQKRIEEIAQKSEDLFVDSLERMAIAIHSEAIKNIAKVSRGKKVTRYKPKRDHVVSKPKGPPNTDRGRLVGSIRWQIDRVAGILQVGSPLKYALYLELGTKRMTERPWLEPAKKKALRGYRKYFKGEISG